VGPSRRILVGTVAGDLPPISSPPGRFCEASSALIKPNAVIVSNQAGDEMSKYDPLKVFLQSTPLGEVPMTFGEVETLIGKPLPPVARKHRAWWSNNPANSVITQAWLDAGFQTARVDMTSEKLVFRRNGSSPLAKSALASSDHGNWLTDLRAKLAGLIKVENGVDLTEPTGEVWNAQE
jgi:hypothetical protein